MIYITDEQQELVLKNIGLVGYVIKHLNLGNHYDYYQDIGMIGLCKGAKTYDPNKGFKESSYLVKCIKYEILRDIRLQNYSKRKINQMAISLDLNINEKTFTTIGELIEDKNINVEEQVINNFLNNSLYNAILRLPLKEINIICSLYGLCGFSIKNVNQLANELNISSKGVYWYKKRILEKLKNGLKEYYKI